MFRDISDAFLEKKNELKYLLDEIVNSDGVDMLPNEIGIGDKKEIQGNVFSDLDSMKKILGKTYKEIKEDKPPNSPNLSKWFENGGSVRIEEHNGKQVWTYIDKIGREVSYRDGYPKFPPESRHSVIGDINIGKFTGDRNEDKKRYLEQLEEMYGLTEIPEGYALHHDSENGNMQLVKSDWHKKFTHAGGHSKFKEG